MPLFRHFVRRHAEHRLRDSHVISQLPCRRQSNAPYTQWIVNDECSSKEVRTGFFNALRRKNALQLSQVMASKLYPNATEPHTTHVNEATLVFFAVLGAVLTDTYECSVTLGHLR